MLTAVGRGGGYIVYWMQQTMRVDDNLALEAALWLATMVGLELLVVVRVVIKRSYQGRIIMMRLHLAFTNCKDILIAIYREPFA